MPGTLQVITVFPVSVPLPSTRLVKEHSPGHFLPVPHQPVTSLWCQGPHSGILEGRVARPPGNTVNPLRGIGEETETQPGSRPRARTQVSCS